jgi:hypothetical protein
MSVTTTVTAPSTGGPLARRDMRLRARWNCGRQRFLSRSERPTYKAKTNSRSPQITDSAAMILTMVGSRRWGSWTHSL